MNREPLLQLLCQHQTADDHEEQMRQRIVSFVSEYDLFYSRALTIGHITASAWVVDEAREHALLVHHGKLQIWVQPGGHLENDADLLTASMREAREETGLQVHPLSEQIFDVDVHEIPANARDPHHFHYDIRFLLAADRHAELIVSRESKALAWVPLNAVTDLTREESVLRMVRKTRGLSSASHPL